MDATHCEQVKCASLGEVQTLLASALFLKLEMYVSLVDAKDSMALELFTNGLQLLICRERKTVLPEPVGECPSARRTSGANLA